MPKELFSEVADSNVPIIRVRFRGQKVPWLRREVKQLISERDHFHKLALRTTVNFTGALTSVYVLLWKGKKRYFKEQLQETKGDSCFTWKNLKQLLRNGSESRGAAARTANATKASVITSFNRFFAIYLKFGISKVGPSITLAIIFQMAASISTSEKFKLQKITVYRRFVRSLKNLNQRRQQVLNYSI